MCHKNNLFLKLKSRERLHIKQLLTLDWLQLKKQSWQTKEKASKEKVDKFYFKFFIKMSTIQKKTV